jgi:hypothetical protein
MANNDSGFRSLATENWPTGIVDHITGALIRACGREPTAVNHQALVLDLVFRCYSPYRTELAGIKRNKLSPFKLRP